MFIYNYLPRITSPILIERIVRMLIVCYIQCCNMQTDLMQMDNNSV